MNEDELRKNELGKKLLYAAGKYSDYSRYENMLAEIEGQYDETLELYNFPIWFGESDGTIQDQAVEMLRVTSDLFHQMRENAEQELYYVVKEIMETDKDIQLELLGILPPAEITDEDYFEEMLLEWDEYEYVQQEALDSFLENLEQYIQYKREEGEF